MLGKLLAAIRAWAKPRTLDDLIMIRGRLGYTVPPTPIYGVLSGGCHAAS